MKASAVRPASKWATFRAAWQASGGPRGRYIDPTLYSDERLAKWLPLKFSTAMPALLWFLMLYDLFFMIVGLQGTVAAWWSPGQGVNLFFWLCSYLLVLFPWLCVDLHKRRRYNLRPKRIIITASSALFILLVASGNWGHFYFVSDFFFYFGWSGILCWDYGIFCINLSGLLPFLVIFGLAFYALYFSFGLVALIRDFNVEPLDEVQAKSVDNELPPGSTSIELADPEWPSEFRQASDTQLSSVYHSSVAEISGHTSVTMPSSTAVSNSLVTAGSARSSTLISSGSSELPAYSRRTSTSENERRSAVEQSQHESLSQPELVHLRY